MIIKIIQRLTNKTEMEMIMAKLEDVKAAVDAESVLIKNVVAYLAGLPALIQQAQGADQAAIDALVAQVQADTSSLQAAVDAAPAEPAPAPVEVPPAE
jgi:cell division FtsZ-interacting protein ZapD